MPTDVVTKAEIDDAFALLEAAMALESDSDCDSSDESLADMLIDEACLPFARQRIQQIGPERLSVARLECEAPQNKDRQMICHRASTAGSCFGLQIYHRNPNTA